MNPSKLAIILYFIDGPIPSPEDIEAAEKIPGRVLFRNSQKVPSEGSMEMCDGVAGNVPPTYAEHYPTADDACAAQQAALAELTSTAGDQAAPTKAPSGSVGKAKQVTADLTKAKAKSTPATKPTQLPAWGSTPPAE